MIVKFGTGWDVTGTVTSKGAEYKTVGDKNTPICTFSLACGKDKDGNSIFINCKAWRELACLASTLNPKDVVRAVGTIEEREYNGKTYKTLVCEWFNCPTAKRAPAGNLEKLSAMVSATSTPSPAPAASSDFMSDLQDSDGELPF